MYVSYVSLCGLSNWFFLCSIYVEYLRDFSRTAFDAQIDKDISSHFTTWFKQYVRF